MAGDKAPTQDEAGYAKSGGAGPCAAGNGEWCDPSLPLGCANCPPYRIIGSFGVDSFHGNSDAFGGYDSNNFGGVVGLNFAMPVVKDRGIGWQLGMTYGVYDVDGRAWYNTAECQQQTFITTGFFHKAQGDQRLSYGVAYDWMLNNNWGLFATAPTLGQWRGQIEYALSNCNAIGVYGCQRDLSSQQTFETILFTPATVSTRAVSQIDVFWHHKFESCADSRIWFGIPDHGRYPVDGVQDGSLYDWIVGALKWRCRCRIVWPCMPTPNTCTRRVGGTHCFPEQSYDISAGVIWYIGGHARKCSINGACWEPYLPVANNSTFLVEQGTEISRN